jgi:hypothetical protein
MKATRSDVRVIDLRDRANLREKVDTILLERVQMILLQRVRRKRKLQPL